MIEIHTKNRKGDRKTKRERCRKKTKYRNRRARKQASLEKWMLTWQWKDEEQRQNFLNIFG